MKYYFIKYVTLNSPFQLLVHQSHDGNTALHEVGRHGNVLVAERLLESPASPDLNIRNQQGLTSFLLLLIKGYKEYVIGNRVPQSVVYTYYAK